MINIITAHIKILRNTFLKLKASICFLTKLILYLILLRARILLIKKFNEFKHYKSIIKDINFVSFILFVRRFGAINS